MKRPLTILGCLLLAAWGDGTTRYQLDLTITREQQANNSGGPPSTPIGGQLGLQGDAALRETTVDWYGSFSTVVAGQTLYVTFSAPRAGSAGVAVAKLIARGHATNLISCEADAHDGMLLVPDAGCSCRDVDFILAFRCPGADGARGTSDDETFTFEGTLSQSGVPCPNKPEPWAPGTLKTGYRTCAAPAPTPAPTPTPTPSPAPAPSPAPSPSPAPTLYGDGGCGGSSDSEWDGGCDGYDSGSDDYDSYDSGGCESSGSDDWSSDSGGCEGDSSSDASCEGDAYATTRAPRRGKRRLWPALGVNLPMVLMAFVGSLALFRRRRRRRSGDAR